jgi:hypothetical protein
MNQAPKSNTNYPWYDSSWLKAYRRAIELIKQICPEKLMEFENAFACLRTRNDFQVRHFPRVFDDAVVAQIKQAVLKLQPTQLELHEAQTFGRFVVHDHPYFTKLHQSIVDLVSEAAEEAVEAEYNFLSIYTGFGVCPLHMDAPRSKWTLDLCIDQSEPWPIHFSQVVPWPVDFRHEGDDWQVAIKRSPQYQFTSYRLQPGQAVVFSGSSQWHYREALPSTPGKQHFCQLLFFHFIPKGMKEFIYPKKWAQVFCIPELAWELSSAGRA